MRGKVRVTRILLLCGICPLTMVMGVKFRKSLSLPKSRYVLCKGQRRQGAADKFCFMGPETTPGEPKVVQKNVVYT